MQTEEVLELIKEVLDKSLVGDKPDIETSKYKVKLYYCKSLPMYAYPLVRIEIQDLELRDYS